MASSTESESFNKFKSLIVYDHKFKSRYRENNSETRLKSRDTSLKKVNISVGSTTRTSYVTNYSSSKKTPQLHKRLSKDNINKLHQHFQGCQIGKIDRGELRDILEKYNIYYTDDEFENLFLKINTDRDDMVDWDELISYMLLGFENDFGDKAKELLDPPIKEKPIIRQTKQRYQIIRIDFFPMVLPNQSVNEKQGIFVTIAIDGTVNFYDLDWELKRIGRSPSPTLKWARTSITDGICLPDIRIICIASTERDLRFYETTANSYALKLHIVQLPEIANTLHYYFNIQDSYSRLTLGDNKGSVRIFEFLNEGRGPFKSNSGALVTTLKYTNLLKDNSYFRITEFNKLHDECVLQVAYIAPLNSVISVAETKSQQALGMFIVDLGVRRTIKSFKVQLGLSCFCYDEKSNTIATGGPDFIIRLWSPFTPQKPFCVFSGHNSGISFIFLQDNGKKCYSVDNTKLIKVWDVERQCLLQTYIYMMNCFLEKEKFSSPMVSYYSDFKRELAVVSGKLALMGCCPNLSFDIIDGVTHKKPISIVLYNQLFDVIITCGFDSFIIVWDSFGTRLNLIKMAHSRVLHGENLLVEITAACFDPKHQLLLTGATDGTLKVWNFNNGFCLRHMSISQNAEITAVFWYFDRILAVGWDRTVTEFAELGIETEYPLGKQWDVQHDEDILCAAISSTSMVLVTACYNGDIVFWHSETGQPYKKFNVKEPKTSIPIVFGGMKKIEQRVERTEFYNISNRLSVLPQYMKIQRRVSEMSESGQKHRRISNISLPKLASEIRQMSIQCTIFLDSRPALPNYGTLLTSLENGKIVVWNHDQSGGYLGHFNAIHMAGDSVCFMTTNKMDTYLFTGTIRGYLKTWLLTNYCVPSDCQTHISMPELRLIFPFLIKTAFLGRAKRSVKTQKMPMLLNSYKAHTKPITSINFIDRKNILLTASSDCSVRLWTLGGQYLGTLGGAIPLIPIPSETHFIHEKTKIPSDIKREASFTTLHVLTGGKQHPVFKKSIEQVKDESFEQKHERFGIYGKILNEPILGKHFKLSTIASQPKLPNIDKSLPYIPIYSHLKVANLHENPNRKQFVDINLKQ